MKTHWLAVLILATALGAAATPASAQGHGKGKSESKGEGKGNDKGNKFEHAQGFDAQGGYKAEHQEKMHAEKAHGHDKARGDENDHGKWKNRNDEWRKHGASHGGFKREFAERDIHPTLRQYIISARAPERIAAGAVSRAFARGVSNNFVITPSGNLVLITNRSGNRLVDLDDERARNLGAWNVTPLGNNIDTRAPSFCRSGAGHPVFGRQWCIDKGFGLGGNRDTRWGRTANAGDIIFNRPVTTGRLTRDQLLSLLGNVAFNRLALHAVTLGYSDPLTGLWIGDTNGPRVLQLNAGAYPVAEIVDTNRDNRADRLVVALRPW